MGRRWVRRPRRERGFGDRVDLRALEGEKSESVGADIEGIGVGTDQRLIAQAGTVSALGNKVRAVFRHVDVIEIEGASRVAGLADGDFDVIVAERVVVLSHGDEPAIRRRVVQALRVAHIEREVDAEKRVGLRRSCQQSTMLVIDGERIVHALEDKAVAYAQGLIRRFDRKAQVDGGLIHVAKAPETERVLVLAEVQARNMRQGRWRQRCGTCRGPEFPDAIADQLVHHVLMGFLAAAVAHRTVVGQ